MNNASNFTQNQNQQVYSSDHIQHDPGNNNQGGQMDLEANRATHGQTNKPIQTQQHYQLSSKMQRGGILLQNLAQNIDIARIQQSNSALRNIVNQSSLNMVAQNQLTSSLVGELIKPQDNHHEHNQIITDKIINNNQVPNSQQQNKRSKPQLRDDFTLVNNDNTQKILDANQLPKTEPMMQASSINLLDINSSQYSSVSQSNSEDTLMNVQPQKQAQSVKNIDSSNRLNLNNDKKGPGYHANYSREVNSLNKINKNPKIIKDSSKKIQKKLNADQSKIYKIAQIRKSRNDLVENQKLHSLQPNLISSNEWSEQNQLKTVQIMDIQKQPIQCCPYNCYRPFALSKNQSVKIPAALFLNLICESVQMPDEHSIIVLALIDRFCNMVQDASFDDQNRFYKRFLEGQSSCSKKFCCKKMQIDSQTIHKLILTSALVTQKFYSDIFYSNHFFAQKCNFIDVKELNALEEIFLDVIDWKITVDLDEYDLYLSGLDQFFLQALQPETRLIIEQNDEAYSLIIQSQNQRLFNQKFEIWSNQSTQKLQVLERMVQNPHMYHQSQFGGHQGNEATASQQLMQLMRGNQQQVLPLVQQNGDKPENMQPQSILDIHLLNLAINCELHRQQNLNTQIQIMQDLSHLQQDTNQYNQLINLLSKTDQNQQKLAHQQNNSNVQEQLSQQSQYLNNHPSTGQNSNILALNHIFQQQQLFNMQQQNQQNDIQQNIFQAPQGQQQQSTIQNQEIQRMVMQQELLIKTIFNLQRRDENNGNEDKF